MKAARRCGLCEVTRPPRRLERRVGSAQLHLKRIAYALPTLALISFFSFLIIELPPATT
jgi:hypothetical protein